MVSGATERVRPTYVRPDQRRYARREEVEIGAVSPSEDTAKVLETVDIRRS
jgi:hypothetical protein